MASVRINKETEDELQICREPSTKAWAILVGLTSLGIGAAYYCNDWFLWKLIYISGAVFVGLSCFEDWEECTFNKKEGQVKLKTETVFQKVFGSENNKTVAADLSELVGVSVKEEDVRYAGKGYMVVMQFETGISLGITETAILGDRSELEAIAQKILAFTNLDQMSEDEGPIADTTVRSSTMNEEEVWAGVQEEGTAVLSSMGGDAETCPASAIEKNYKEAELSMSIPVITDERKITSTTTNSSTQRESDSSSSDEGFEKIEKPPSDDVIPTE